MAYNETHEQDWLAERDHVEQLAVPYEPKNIIDLSWKIMFLSEINREKYASQIEALINKLYEFESPKGLAISLRQEGQAGGLYFL